MMWICTSCGCGTDGFISETVHSYVDIIVCQHCIIYYDMYMHMWLGNEWVHMTNWKHQGAVSLALHVEACRNIHSKHSSGPAMCSSLTFWHEHVWTFWKSSHTTQVLFVLIHCHMAVSICSPFFLLCCVDLLLVDVEPCFCSPEFWSSGAKQWSPSQVFLLWAELVCVGMCG